MTVRPEMDAELEAQVRPFVPGTEEEGCDALLTKSNEFLDAFRWARRTGKVWVGDCVPGVWGLFLVESIPQRLRSISVSGPLLETCRLLTLVPSTPSRQERLLTGTLEKWKLGLTQSKMESRWMT